MVKTSAGKSSSSARSITRRNSGIAVFWKEARKATRVHYFPLIIRDIWEKVTKKWL
ncbi:MAG: hypothetical protein GH151_05705 [Bacteroidetes bacterium]|nr:hypothetical protein [Bacteroidota bacterium]